MVVLVVFISSSYDPAVELPGLPGAFMLLLSVLVLDLPEVVAVAPSVVLEPLVEVVPVLFVEAVVLVLVVEVDVPLVVVDLVVELVPLFVLVVEAVSLRSIRVVLVDELVPSVLVVGSLSVVDTLVFVV